eukprot:GCRY01003275.1.p1 GENE.GCRY01003275.1~~GCRY01003275.1.p1  ORF type:complete len:245 (+),score=18.93 GCRY01003275.1:450-1184(+)
MLDTHFDAFKVTYEELQKNRDNVAKKPKPRLRPKPPSADPTRKTQPEDAPPITKPKQRKRALKPPQEESGGWACLIALFKVERENNFLTPAVLSKKQLIDVAQLFSRTSFFGDASTNYFSAWSSVSTMIKNDLMAKTSHPPKYRLTAEGRLMAKNLWISKFGDDGGSLPTSALPLPPTTLTTTAANTTTVANATITTTTTTTTVTATTNTTAAAASSATAKTTVPLLLRLLLVLLLLFVTLQFL